MKFAFTVLTFMGSLVFSPYYFANPNFNGSTPGCGGSGCHSVQAGIVTLTQLGNNQVRVSVSGTSSRVAGELVDVNGSVVAVNNSTNTNPFILTAPAPGNYTVNAGFKNPNLRWASAQIDLTVPVELTSFIAVLDGNLVELKWSTATETNNYGFEIERSENKSVWKNIGFINGAGNSNSQKEYSFVEKIAESGKYFYRLKQIDLDGTFEYSPTVEIVIQNPKTFELTQNYPNPFNPSTRIQYQVSSNSHVSLKVFDIIGNEVATLADEYKSAGSYEVEFGAANLASGIYFYKLQAGSFVETKKMILLH